MAMKPLRVKTRMEAPRVLDMMVAWKANISLMWFCTEQGDKAEEHSYVLLSGADSAKLRSVAKLLPRSFPLVCAPLVCYRPKPTGRNVQSSCFDQRTSDIE
jgi:hypothetical protein